MKSKIIRTAFCVLIVILFIFYCFLPQKMKMSNIDDEHISLNYDNQSHEIQSSENEDIFEVLTKIEYNRNPFFVAPKEH